MELESGGSNRGHGHQNEAAFYILKGKGFEIHDGQRYDWEKGDLVVVHNDSVHRHFNNSADPALALVIKAKSTWMLLGLVQQGPALQDFEGQYGRREDWSKLWSPDAVNMKKVVKPSASEWQTTRDGRVRILCSQDRRDVRIFSVDLYEQEIPAGSRSAKHWHMADEVLYVVSGRGYSLHWEVEAEITDRYYARVPNEPTEHRFNAGDLLYVPANCIHQHFNDSAEAPLVLLSGQNRLFKLLGYDSTAYLEDAPEYAARR